MTYSGTALPVVNGGTGQTTYTDGQLLIGNSTGNTLTKATLTAGTNVTITNAAGAITIAASGGGGGSPGGSTTQVQYNNAGAFGGISGVTTDGTRITHATTLSVGGATPSTSGSGITFPATQSASSDANTLDDYEEGTFSPTIVGTSTAGTATYNARVASYTKIGRFVQFEIYMYYSNGTGTGDLRISNLPFTANGTTYSAVTVAYPNSLALSASNVVTAWIAVNTASIEFYQYPVGGGGSTPVAYDVSAEFMLTGTYTI
jgi:hypothetical protein